MLPYGCDGYQSVLVVFKPEITRAYCRVSEMTDGGGLCRARARIEWVRTPEAAENR